MAARIAALLAALWAGVLLTVAGVATPAGFALLPRADAGRMAARILGQEAWISLALAAALWLLLRQVRGEAGRRVERGLAAAAIGLTLVGWFGVQALLPAARAGQGPFSFAQLHGFSTLCFALKTLLVLALAWRLTARRAGPGA
ncbi:MAG TPA: DUF4149 domain-containing protein [Rubrivivax sp.]|nr:DUF4149 domain-containing protein [Rubrivivax sp.]HRZ61262.1 DUF4149 domain-containing protein [Rubrivivax sp.]